MAGGTYKYPGYYEDSLAIIGISCEFPGAGNYQQFWGNIREGKESSRFLDEAELRSQGVSASMISDPKYIPVDLSIDGKYHFDAEFFNISRNNAILMDPQFRLLLQHSWKAVEDAGYASGDMPDTAVFMATANAYYQSRMGRSIDFDDSEDYVAWMLAQSGSIPTRISYELGFLGPSISIHTNCSSSLVALSLAYESLKRKEVKYALVGASKLFADARPGYFYEPGMNFSSDGRCRAFDASADGLIAGEGAAVIVVKRAMDAIEDGDHIYALVRGVGINNDGADKAGFYAPSVTGQANAIDKVLRDTQIDPATIGFVEAHGTGTKLGDPIEIAALTEAYGRYVDKKQYCAIGSVKPNIGHLDAAAGLAGCIKAALSLKHGIVPPSINYSTPNPFIDFENSPFYVADKEQEWPVKIGPRRAGVSAFGIGGTNAHTILEAYTDEAERESDRAAGDCSYLIPLSARNGERLAAALENLLAFLDGPSAAAADVGSLSYTLQVGRKAMASRVAFVSTDLKSLAEQLRTYLSGHEAPGCFHGEVTKGSDLGDVFDDGDSVELIRTWAAKRNYASLAKLWVRGGEVDWAAVYGASMPRRMSLPTYPFAKEICRMDLPATVQQVTGAFEQLHPLLHRNTSTSFDTQFTSTFSGEEFFLKDHQIGDTKVLPAVAHLEMARAAVRQAFGLPPIADSNGAAETTVIELKNVVWLQPAVASHDGLTLHVSVTPSSDTEALFEIYGISSDGEEIPYSQGRCRLAEAMRPTAVDLAQLRKVCTDEPVTSDEIIASFSALGAHLGYGHRAIETVLTGSDERRQPQALVMLRKPDVPGEFGLHPGVLDSALQAYVGLYLTDGSTSSALANLPLSLPFALSSITIFRNLPNTGCAWLRFSEGHGPHDANAKIDATFCDDQGNVCAVLAGLEKREPRSSNLAGEASISTSLYKAGWRSAPPEPASAASPIAEQRVLLVGAFTKDQHDTLRSALPGTVDCQRLSATGRSLAARYTETATKLIDYMRNLITGKPRDPVLVQIVIHPADPCFSGLSGLLRTATLENLKLATQCIQLQDDLDAIALSRLIQENARDLGAQEIRHGGRGERYVKHYDEVPLVDAGAPGAGMECRWKDDGVYLITGGLGGLGLIFARDIAVRARRTVVIAVGRSTLDADRQKHIDEFAAQGLTVDYQCVDVADTDAVAVLFEHIRGTYGRVTAILHSAGVVHDSYIVNKNADEIRKVFAPKVAGTINLDEASEGLGLEQFVLFSSIAATLGNLGQADYAAANGFMDAYAEYRNELVSRGERQGSTLSIDWPGWAQGGMDVDAAVHAQKRLQGFSHLGAEQGLDAYSQGLRLGGDHIVVLTGEMRRLRVLLEASLRASPKAAAASPSPNPAPGDLVSQGLRDKLLELLKQQVSTQLKIPAQDLRLETELSEYGFDSISFTSLSNQLNERFRLDLTPTIFFDYPSLGGFANFLVEEHGTHLANELRLGTNPRADSMASNAAASPDILPITKNRARRGRNASWAAAIDKGRVGAHPHREPIAIVGMSGRFPQCDDVDGLWEVLKTGRDCITEIPADRWDWREIYGDPDTEGEKTNIKWAGFIDGIDQFDPLFFNISPAEARMMDPQQRLLMTYAWKAIEDAGHAPASLSGSRTGIFVGTVNSDYHKLLARAGVPTNAFSSIGTAMSLGPNRISYLLNLHGPSEPIETACSSSLVAIHRAVRAILSGECDQALAGGVNTIPSPDCHIAFSKVGALSKDGRCKTFSRDANGFVRAEGVGMLLLKPLSAAERDGDHVYAVIKGSSENHGGRAGSFTAPNPKAQAELIKSAYRDAQIDPRSVTYIEAHGSGTPLGDPIEINGLKSAFGTLSAEMPESDVAGEARCGLGSLKSNIGHTEFAAGVAGVIKVILQMQHKTLAGSLHSKPANPYIDFSGSPFYVVEDAQAWNPLQDRNGNSIPRRAGVSSFGFGGVNCHVVLEEHVPASRTADRSSGGAPPAIIVLSAKTEAQLGEQVTNLHQHLEQKSYDDGDLPSIAYTLQVGRDAMEHRLAMTVTSIDELKRKLRACGQSQGSEGPVEGCHRGTKAKDQGLLATLIADDDFAHTIDKWLRQEKYAKLMELWVNGLSIDWASLYDDGAVYGGPRPRRISLPTYAFARERYWVEPSGGPVSIGVGGQLHPLVHRNTSTIFGTRFSSRFSGEEFFLKDHQVGKTKIFPGTAHLEMARAAVRQAYGLPDRESDDSAALELTDVVWLRPAKASDDGLSLQIRVEAISDTVAKFEIYGVDPEAQEQIYSQGRARFLDNTPPGLVDLDRLRGICTHRLPDSGAIYAAFSALGVEYGPGHQAIDAVHAGADDGQERQVLAALRMPDVRGDFGLHPGMLDSALQAFVGLHVDGESASLTLAALPLSLPFALSSIVIHRDLPKAAYAWVRYSDGSGAEDAVRKIDVSVCDEGGRICAAISGLSTRTYQDPAASASDQVPLQALVPCWTAVSGSALRETSVSLPAADTTVIVCADDLPNAELWRMALPGAVEISGLAGLGPDELAARFSAATGMTDLLWVLPQDACDRIDADLLIAEQSSGVLFGLRLLQALLSSSPSGRELRLTVVTWQTQAVAAEVHYPAHASVHGLVGSLAKEIPHWSVRLLDLPVAPDGEMLTSGLSLPSDAKGDAWAHREGQWYRRHLLPAELPSPDRAASLYREEGVYIVVGGAGGIGEVFSEHLIRGFRAQLVWLGRRELNEEIEAKLDRLSTLGLRPIYLQADATNRDALMRARQHVLGRFGVIHGIIHSAIALNDKSIAMMDADRFSASLRAKVDTSVRLAQVFKDDGLDLFLFFSSVQSFVKAAGQSNYAAGCTFADSFAERMERVLSCRVKIMNWGYWGSVGVVTDQAYRDRAAKLGFGSIEPAGGLAALQEFLSLDIPQLAVMSITKPAALDSVVGAVGQKIRILAGSADRWEVLFDAAGSPLAKRLEKIKPPYLNKAKQADHAKFEELQLQLLWRQLGRLELRLDEAGYRVAPVLPLYQAWTDEAVRRLRVAGYPDKASDASSAQPWSQWDDLKTGTAVVGLEEQMELAGATLSALPDILTGLIPATDMLFPNGSMGKVEAVYKHNPQAHYFNAVLTEAVVARVAAADSGPGQKLRLLEIGAGTGGTSECIFKALEPYRDQIEIYSYTDISKAFLLHAEKSYRDAAPYMECRLLNIEQDLSDQGFALGSYDIVIAANVLHATRNMHETLRHTKAAMKADGILLLNEITRNTLFAHLTFGLTEGWWLAEDAECRIAGSPILSCEKWHSVLSDEGFPSIQWPASSAAALGHQVIVAHSDGVIRLPDRADRSAQAPLKKVHRTAIAAAPAPVERPTASSASLRQKTVELIRKELSATLQIPQDHLENGTPLADYGVDSILAAQVARSLAKVFDEVSANLLFDYPTIDALADHFIAAQPGRLQTHFHLSGACADPSDGGGSAAMQAAPSSSLRVKMETLLKEQLSSTLQIPLSHLEAHVPLADYGVDSILAAQVARSLGKVFENVSSVLLFEYPTIEALTDHFVATQADRLEAHFGVTGEDAEPAGPATLPPTGTLEEMQPQAGKRHDKPSALGASPKKQAVLASGPELQRWSGEGPTPLSSLARLFWMRMQQGHLGVALQNLPVCVQFEGDIDRDALDRALATLAEWHPMLVSRIVEIDGEPNFELGSQLHVEYREEVGSVAKGDATEHMEVLREFAFGPFDIHQQLSRALILKIGDRMHVICVVVHHLAADAFSLPVIMKDLVRLCEFESSSESPAALSAAGMNFIDYLKSIAAWNATAAAKSLMDSYSKDLAESTAVSLVPDIPEDDPRRSSPQRGEIMHRLPSAFAETLRRIAKRESLTDVVPLMCALQLVVWAENQQTDFVINVLSSNRDAPEIVETVGFFAKPIMLRLRLDETMTIQDLLRSARRCWLDTLQTAPLPSEVINRSLPDEIVNSAPFLNWIPRKADPTSHEHAELRNTYTSIEVRAPQVASKNDITNSKITSFAIYFYEHEDHVVLHVMYPTIAFSSNKMERVIRYFVEIIDLIDERPLLPITSVGELWAESPISSNRD